MTAVTNFWAYLNVASFRGNDAIAFGTKFAFRF